MIRSHTFDSSEHAYNVSQTSDAVHDGDILLVPNEGRVAVLVGAWPVLVGSPTAEGGEFHNLATGTFMDLEDGKYHAAAVVAIVLLTVSSMQAAGLGRDERLLAIARSHGWAGEIPAQERFAPYA